MVSKKVFCLGLLCDKRFRKNKCKDCQVYVCKGVCSAGNGSKLRCIDCYVDYLFKKTDRKIEKWLKNY